MTIKTDTQVNELIVNNLTTAEYKKADSIGEISDTELYNFSDKQLDVESTLKVTAGNGVSVVNTKTSSFDNALSCWHFENSFIDSVNNLSLENRGALTTAQKKFGNYSFIPSTIITPLENKWNLLDTSSFTIDFWAKNDSSTQGDLVLGLTGVQFANQSFVLVLSKGGFESININTSDKQIEQPNDLVVENDWNHFALTYNNKESYLFINGTKVSKIENINASAGFSYFTIFRTDTNMNVFVDELRISSGVKFTDNFIPANVAYEKNETIVSADVTTQVLNTALANKQNILTSTQLSAVNSGITNQKVIKYDSYEDTINGKQDTLEAGDNIEITGNIISAKLEIPDSVYTQTNLVGGKDIEIVKDDTTNVYKINTSVDVLTVQEAQDTYATLMELADKRDNMSDVEDSEITEVNLTVVPNTNYEYGELTSLNIVSVTKSYLESTIFFTAGADDCLTYPSELKTMGTISIKSGKSYAISILNNIMIIGELN